MADETSSVPIVFFLIGSGSGSECVHVWPQVLAYFSRSASL